MKPLLQVLLSALVTLAVLSALIAGFVGEARINRDPAIRALRGAMKKERRDRREARRRRRDEP